MAPNSTFSGAQPHIAIIMDGNGRWATSKRRPRLFGHQAGVRTVRRIVQDARDIGVKCLTLYSFSTENWTRPKAEIRGLFELLKSYIHDDLDELHANNVRVNIIGSREGLPADIAELIDKVIQTTEDNTAFSLNIAFNYGGRDEILRACRSLIDAGAKSEDLDEDLFESHLDTHDLPSVDLVIRTSGEYRISNYLLWQTAYAEFVFTDVLWPDFTKDDLEAAITEYRCRNRRFGNVGTAGAA